MSFQIALKSQKGRKKDSHERNGDYCAWLEEQHCMVLALADGVGSCSNDARASKTVCDSFLGKCRTALSNGETLTEMMLCDFCRTIDSVLAVDNDMVCFCAVVWRTDDDKVIWIHVGDTRIYKHSKADGMRQMTADDHAKAVNIKLNGKLYTDHGALVAATPIDNAIGDRNCRFHTGSFVFLHGESIVLCSDGMYGSSGFAYDVESLLEKPDIEEAIAKIDTTDDDDASLLILRRNLKLAKSDKVQDLMERFDDYRKTMPLSALTDRFSDELEEMIDTHTDAHRFADTVSFMKSKQLYPDRKRIDAIFNAALHWMKTSDGDEKKLVNEACFDLKDILRYVFTH